MTEKQLFHTLAKYNLWMNDKVYEASAGLSDAERKADRGAFFKSIHSTLNHLLFGDRAWMNRLAATTYEIKPIGEDLFEDFADLTAARRALDQDILDWTASLGPDQLEGGLTWRSGVDGVERTRPRGQLIMTMFNHQTHHRGQITTLFSQLGIDIGGTDLWSIE